MTSHNTDGDSVVAAPGDGDNWHPELDRPAAERALRLAELIVDRSAYGVWHRSTYPTVDQMATDLDATLEDLDVAVALLQWRRLLFPQHDPESGHRLLPSPELGTRKAAVQGADRIALRIKLGLWTGDNFPTVGAISELFGSALGTITAAMQILKNEGVMHKIIINTGITGRGSRKYVWRPTDVADQAVRDLAPVLRQAIATGELGPILPSRTEMAEQHCVAAGLVADAYLQLQREGVIGIGWLPRIQHRIWYVIGEDGAPEGVLPGEVRSIAIATRLLQDLPEWLLAHRNGTWFRKPLPTQRDLVGRYRVHAYDVERASELLVRLQILERAPVAGRIYLPRPPADLDSAHGLTFRVIGKQPPRPWVPARQPCDWLPLPTSANDENVRAVDALRPRVGHKNSGV